jgi:signal peptidase II
MAEIHSHARPPGPLSAFGLGIAGAVIVVDQIAKLIVEARLPEGWAIDVLPILTLLRVRNTGIAFSLFAGSGFGLIVLPLAVTVIVLAFWAYNREGGRPAAAGFALILGGAIGNLIDRLRLGYVTDFLLLHFGSWTLFVFNLADAALTLGPALLLLVYLWPAKPDAQRQEPRQNN